MPEQPVDTEAPTAPDTPADVPLITATSLEFEQIFKQMVAMELARGPLPYRRRRKLMRYASQIDIKPFRASLLIAEAEREAGLATPIERVEPDDFDALLHPERWPIWFKLTVGLIIAVLVDVVVLRALGW